MSLQRIKLVTFDATNTLLKFKQPPWKYYEMAAKDYGLEGARDLEVPLKDSFRLMWERHPNFGRNFMTWQEWWREVVKMTFKAYVPISVDIDPLANRLIDEFRTSRCWSVTEGGSEIVELLKKQKISTGVISNFDPRLKDVLQDVGLINHFEFIITSYDVGFSKPDRRIFDTALNMVGGQVQADEALHIGDDKKKDYEGAIAAGWNAILIDSNFKTETPPAKKHVFRSLNELYLSISQNTLVL